MAHITKLPSKLSYYESNGLKVLDIRATYVEAIPKELKGVDVVLARKNQIEYIAPDYQGHLLEIENSKSKLFYAIPERIVELKKAFEQRESLGPLFFDTPRSAQRVCSSDPDEEMHLPSKLSFHWNPQQRVATLNAGRTWLLERPVIRNVFEVIMPNLDKMRRRLQFEKVSGRNKKRQENRKDHDFFCSITGGVYKQK